MNQFGAQKFSFKKPFMILMFIGIGIGSVSADMKKILSAIYRIGRFEKWDLSVLIGIGRYEKKLIGRTLKCTTISKIIITSYYVAEHWSWFFSLQFILKLLSFHFTENNEMKLFLRIQLMKNHVHIKSWKPIFQEVSMCAKDL